MSRHEFYKCDRCRKIYVPREQSLSNSVLLANRIIRKPRNINNFGDSFSTYLMIPLPPWIQPDVQEEEKDNRYECNLCKECDLSLAIWFNEPMETGITYE